MALLYQYESRWARQQLALFSREAVLRKKRPGDFCFVFFFFFSSSMRHLHRVRLCNFDVFVKFFKSSF